MTTAIPDLISDLLVSKYEVSAEEISPDTVFEDLSLDSLALMEMSLALEKKLGITISEGTLAPQQTLGEAASVLGLLHAAA